MDDYITAALICLAAYALIAVYVTARRLRNADKEED